MKLCFYDVLASQNWTPGEKIFKTDWVLSNLRFFKFSHFWGLKKNGLNIFFGFFSFFECSMPKNLNINKKKKMFFKFSVKVVRYGLKRVSPLLFEVKKKKKVELFLDLNEATTRYRRFLRLKKSKIDPPYCGVWLHVVMHTVEFDSSVWCILWSQTRGCASHRGVKDK